MNQPRSKIETATIPQFTTGLGQDQSGEAVALIERMAKEDGSALTELHEMWSPILLGAACRMLGDRREAEEAVQDTFVRMWHRSVDYDPKQSPPFVWAFAVMRGYCIDRLRYRHRGKRDSSRVVPIHLHSVPEELEDPRVMALDDWRRVRSALNILEKEERRCLELAIFLEYTHSEISAHLGTPLGTVKNRLRRALEKVRNQLSRHEF
ncbi:MAG: RNA polymerase sigma factor [Luteolibacter sp.]|uniref:RNA polymerase sigma factor n=1 Tax=Luteolibacter sp. TaxID=1962973 RepID=UPI003262D803